MKWIAFASALLATTPLFAQNEPFLRKKPFVITEPSPTVDKQAKPKAKLNKKSIHNVPMWAPWQKPNTK